MNTRFAAAINDQGRFANVNVGDFILTEQSGRHTWQGKTAATIEELAEQVNGAIASLTAFGNPWLELKVIAVDVKPEEQKPADSKTGEEPVTDDSVKSALVDANAELQNLLGKTVPKKPTLELIQT